MIYKICTEQEWQRACEKSEFNGSAVDVRDGFIHFSSKQQLRETASKHFHGCQGLVLVEIDSKLLGADLRWEVSRGGDLFPHLYGPLPTAAAVRVLPLPIDDSGKPMLPLELG